MAKWDLQLAGFTFKNSSDAINKPDGALITGTQSKDSTNISAYKLNRVPLKEFNSYVEQGRVRDLKLKDGELIWKTMNKSIKKDTVNNAAGGLIGAAAGAGIIASEGAAGAAGAGVVLGTAGEVIIDGALVSEVVVEGAAAGTALATTGAAAAGTTALATTGTTAVAAGTTAVAATGTTAATTGALTTAGAVASTAALPLALALGTAVALTGITAFVKGTAMSHKIYEYTPLRMCTEHVEKADSSPSHIAMCIANIVRKKNTVTAVVYAYGSGVKNYVVELLQQIPQLAKIVPVPATNIACVPVPYEFLLDEKFKCGRNLMFNTQILSDKELSKNITKTTKLSGEQLSDMKAKLIEITKASMSVNVSDSKATAAKPVTSNIKAYCEKFGYTLEYFEANEKSRLCTILGCSEAELDSNLGVLVG